MRPIQYLLLLLLAPGVLLYAWSWHSRLVDRMLVLALGAAGLTLVAFPDASQWLADLVNVGRGVDLMMYLALLGLGYLFLILFARQRDIDERITRLSRAMAIDNARQPERAPREAGPRPGAE